MHYVKEFFSGEVPEWVHERFIRYGRGSFAGPKITVKSGKNIRVSASIDYANILGELIAKNAGDEVSASGMVFAKRDIEPTLKDFFTVGKSKSSKGLRSCEVTGEVSGDELAGLCSMLPDTFILLDLKSGKQKLKFKKKKLPKPGSKLKDSFCVATLAAGALDELRDELLFGVEGDFEEAVVSHELVIEELVKPDGVTDSARLRVESKRKGRIKRTLTVDGKTTEPSS